MKTYPVSLCLAVFSLAGWTNSSAASTDSADSATAAATAAAAVPVATAPDASAARWSDIADCTFQTRARFFAGLKRLEARVDGQVAELKAKRAIMAGTVDTADWDFAMKEMSAAREYLRSMGEELGNSTFEAWNQQKAKVGEAWVRTQNAYDKVKSTTTS